MAFSICPLSTCTVQKHICPTIFFLLCWLPLSLFHSLSFYLPCSLFVTSIPWDWQLLGIFTFHKPLLRSMNLKNCPEKELTYLDSNWRIATLIVNLSLGSKISFPCFTLPPRAVKKSYKCFIKVKITQL